MKTTLYEHTGHLLRELLGDGGYERGFWPTPYNAVPGLMQHLPKTFTYCEPCVGRGDLVSHIAAFRPTAMLTQAYDIHPLIPDTKVLDAKALTIDDARSPIHGDPDFFITNPPWIGVEMVQIINRLRVIKPTWVLLNGTFLHTTRGAKILPYCKKIVSIGRQQWVPGSKGTGKIDGVWALFDKDEVGQPVFHPYVRPSKILTDAERQKVSSSRRAATLRKNKQLEAAKRKELAATVARRRQEAREARKILWRGQWITKASYIEIKNSVATK